jgi:serine protease Do
MPKHAAMPRFRGVRSPFRLLVCAAAVCVTVTSRAETADPSPTAAAAAAHEVAARVLPAVVRIEAIRLAPMQGRMVKAQVGGSGAIIDDTGHVLTNYHVTEDAEFFLCHLTDGTVFEARKVGEDALTDLAVLKLDLTSADLGDRPLPVARFGDSDALRVGEPVLALGSPASLAQAVTQGVVSNAALVMPEGAGIVLAGENVGLIVRWILHDASIFPGNSGGPLVNLAGEIVGINELGVARLGGAIPGNLARRIADELVATGAVKRGWSGLTVQKRLGERAELPGLVVADVAPDSPSAEVGVKPGWVLVSYAGEPIGPSGDAALAEFYRRETSLPPEANVALVFETDGTAAPARVEATLRLRSRDPALEPGREVRAWGAIFRDLNAAMARRMRFPDTDGVLVQDVRPGGPAGQGEPELRNGDVLLAIEGDAVRDLEALRAWTRKGFPEGSEPRLVLVDFRRGAERMQSVVELREASQRQVTPQARRAWIGVETQPLTPKLGARLGVDAPSGVRITAVHPGTRAEQAGLAVGDVVLAIDGAVVTSRRSEDADTFARQVRQYRSGREVPLRVWRAGTTIEVPIVLEQQPVPGGELPAFVDARLELTVRELAFEDRNRLRLGLEQPGILVENVERAGWAALAGLRGDDVLLEAGGEPVRDVAHFESLRNSVLEGDGDWWILQLLRAGQTLYVQINLQAARS